MPRPSSSQPTEVELQILRILWDLGPSPVRAIHQRLEADKGTNYSTTVKMLAVMPDSLPEVSYLTSVTYKCIVHNH